MTTKYPLLFVLALAAACGHNHPSNHPPTVADASVSTPEDTPVAITVSPEDADGDALEVTFASPSNGTLTGMGTSVTYTPHANFAGEESLTVTVSDGHATATATIKVTVQPVNDAPVAGNDTATTDENVPLTLAASTLLANDTDVEGQTLTVTGVSGAVSGTVTLAGTNVLFTPTANFSGPASFQYTVSDGALTATATVAVTVNPVNDAPVAGNDTATTNEDVPLTLAASTLLANDTDVEGQTLTISAVQNPSNGMATLSGTNITFSPNADFNGAAAFEYVATDGQSTSIGLVTVTVTPVNDAPVATNVTVTVAHNTATAITLTATDVEGDALTFTIATPPAHGTLSGTGANRTFTPEANFGGQDSLTFTASDGSLTSNSATVSLTIKPPPACGDGTVDPNEVCDDGNRTAGDGCRADCRGLEVCGDGLVDSTTGEQCDDGNTSSGDGCSASCQLDPFSNVPSTIISGALSCNTNTSNTGRKAAVDALGRFFVVMNCGGTGYVSVSLDRGLTWVGPTSLGITGVAEIAIEGGPTGTAYVVALANPGKVIFTRTLDAGATWETPRELSNAVEAEVSMDSLGDAIYISVSTGAAGLRILRNSSRGTGDFIATDLAQSNSFHDLIVDKISGDVFSVSDNPAFHIRRSSDGGASFGAESAPPGQAFFSDWTGSNGFIYAIGTFGDDNVDVIPVSAPGTSSQVTGLPTNVGPGPFRSIDSDALGNGYVVTQLSSGAVQLDRMLVGATSIAATDARPIGTSGTYPAVAALPSNTGALVSYTSGTSVYGAVVVY